VKLYLIDDGKQMMNDTSNNTTKDNARLIASYLMSLSLFAIAGSIAYFTYEVAIISKYIPDVLVQIDSTTDKIEPVLEEVAEITGLVPNILVKVEELHKTIPPILKEIELTRKMIPSILKEVEQTRKQIPAVLKESEAIRGELPAMLATADKASGAVVGVSEQIPAILIEVETTRESIPPLMDRADILIDKARVAGKEASQGAVTGIFSGILLAPFALIADAGRGLSGMSAEEAKAFTEKDFELIKQDALQLLDEGSVGDEVSWNNTESGNNGTVILANSYKEGEYAEIECRKLKYKSYNHDKLLNESERAFCKSDDGKWDFDE
jgi:surface antigen/archaellum component FlaC